MSFIISLIRFLFNFIQKYTVTHSISTLDSNQKEEEEEVAVMLLTIDAEDNALAEESLASYSSYPKVDITGKSTFKQMHIVSDHNSQPVTEATADSDEEFDEFMDNLPEPTSSKPIRIKPKPFVRFHKRPKDLRKQTILQQGDKWIKKQREMGEDVSYWDIIR